MKTPLIHIGYHKTGTTWLQREVFRCQNSVFETLDIPNPETGRLGMMFVATADPRQHLSPFDSNEQAIRKRLSELAFQLPGLAHKTPVISCERLSGNPHGGSIDAKSIAERIRLVFPTAKILIVLREQVSFVRSLYFQYLKRGGTEHIRDYLRRRQDGVRSGFEYHQPEYVGLIRCYQNLFGKANVCVLPYERFVAEPEEFVRVIGQFAGVEIPIDPGQYLRRHNASWHPCLHFHMRWVGRFLRASSVNGYSAWAGPRRAAAVRWLFRVLGRAGVDRLNKRTILHVESIVSEYLGDRYALTNRELELLIGTDLKSYGYRVQRKSD